MDHDAAAAAANLQMLIGCWLADRVARLSRVCVLRVFLLKPSPFNGLLRFKSVRRQVYYEAQQQQQQQHV